MSDQAQQFAGTMPVPERHLFDMAALQAYLEKQLPGFQGPLSVESFKGGQSNPTFRLNTPSRSYVMRSKPGPVAKLLPSAHAIEREYRVIGALAVVCDEPERLLRIDRRIDEVLGEELAAGVMGAAEGREHPALVQQLQ